VGEGDCNPERHCRLTITYVIVLVEHRKLEGNQPHKSQRPETLRGSTGQESASRQGTDDGRKKSQNGVREESGLKEVGGGKELATLL